MTRASAVNSRDVRRLPCSDHLKEVIYRCLGARGKRYEAAGELISALRQRPKEPHLGRVAKEISVHAKRSRHFGVDPAAVDRQRRAGERTVALEDRQPEARPHDEAGARFAGPTPIPTKML